MAWGSLWGRVLHFSIPKTVEAFGLFDSSCLIFRVKKAPESTWQVLLKSIAHQKWKLFLPVSKVTPFTVIPLYCLHIIIVQVQWKNVNLNKKNSEVLQMFWQAALHCRPLIFVSFSSI
jgi:hypothetical protein